MKNGLVPVSEQTTDIRWQNIDGTAAPATSILRSPASATPCVHWRLRIRETLSPSVFVHDVASEEPFEVEWLTDPALPPQRLRIDARRARLDAMATFHEAGSPGARAVAQAFGLAGTVSVEEILIRPGIRLEVEGVMLAPQTATPFRDSQPEFALDQVSVRVPGPLRRTALLPWALGTSAALFGVLGAAGAVLRRVEATSSAKAFVNWVKPLAEVSKPRPVHRRWP